MRACDSAGSVSFATGVPFRFIHTVRTAIPPLGCLSAKKIDGRESCLDPVSPGGECSPTGAFVCLAGCAGSAHHLPGRLRLAFAPIFAVPVRRKGEALACSQGFAFPLTSYPTPFQAMARNKKELLVKLSPLTLEYWALERLLSPSCKLRKNDPAVARMASSIEAYGLKIPILVAETARSSMATCA
jgi:hypothetical protein